MFTDIDSPVTIGRYTATVTIEHDSFHGAPWKENDGHGIVSDWTMRPKAPGELVLNTDGNSRRYYDFAATCKIALRDEWNSAPYDIAGETKRQRAARAAMADFERLRDWCNDHWHYVGVIIEVSAPGMTTIQDSIWGIESDDSDGILTYANDMLSAIIPQLSSHRDMIAADIGLSE